MQSNTTLFLSEPATRAPVRVLILPAGKILQRIT
ncbi:MAG: hypothetical protein ACI8PP_000876, partial [Candidatus Pseudothioglobus sp.]